MISVIVISYNSRAFLADCLESVLSQIDKGDQVVVIDNASTDGSQDLVRESFPDVSLLEFSENTGYAVAANRGIERTEGEYVLILNPDAILGHDYLKEALHALDRNPGAAGVTGKTYQYRDTASESTCVIDSVGLVGSRGRQFLDMGAALVDSGQFASEGEIFGVSGHCALFRRSALEDASIDGECFDEDFFMYKEDIDLCWRLRLLGWTFCYAPRAVAYHKRGTGILARNGLGQSIRARRTLNQMQQYYSFRNHRLILIKNEFWETFVPDFLFIGIRETASLAWLLVRETRNAGVVFDLIRMLPRILRKRRVLMRRRQVSGRALLPWLQGRWGSASGS